MSKGSGECHRVARQGPQDFQYSICGHDVGHVVISQVLDDQDPGISLFVSIRPGQLHSAQGLIFCGISPRPKNKRSKNGNIMLLESHFQLHFYGLDGQKGEPLFIVKPYICEASRRRMSGRHLMGNVMVVKNGFAGK